ncbi:uncharacterized protein B0I36DRAFT_320057 [Microdochium trichocladiopsis]|uniref:Uncharacterized protein n=1 Tax=Microdochium trichocladiopsis TaxID=1682393 RepID=A0A9P8Y8S3_9PEZI|nr:uncharacterized protein B0I36DRAFT_320057 [Microdochium trichocladiopsis]KAH7032796.1 hypothetical protein B0I36DRAFT_320057 [Microdochium trichocladiopsis]
MRTPVARGSRVPPWPSLTCSLFIFLRFFFVFDSASRALCISSMALLKWAEGLKWCWQSRMTWAELMPMGLLMAKTPSTTHGLEEVAMLAILVKCVNVVKSGRPRRRATAMPLEQAAWGV